MSISTDEIIGKTNTEEILGRIKNRLRILTLASTLVVALAFGLSFYFALISNETAVARHVPELEVVATKLKNILVINTVAFVGVIIASFYFLSVLLTSKMFRPLGTLQRNLSTIAEGKLPKEFTKFEGGPFASLEDALHSALSTLHNKERKEIEELQKCSEMISRLPAHTEARAQLEEVLKNKQDFLHKPDRKEHETEKKKDSDTVFMQPV